MRSRPARRASDWPADRRGSQSANLASRGTCRADILERAVAAAKRAGTWREVAPADALGNRCQFVARLVGTGFVRFDGAYHPAIDEVQLDAVRQAAGLRLMSQRVNLELER